MAEKEAVVKSYTLTITGPEREGIARRIDRFMAWLHTASSWGHSGIVAMSLDGDGWEKVKVDGIGSGSVEYIRWRRGRSQMMRVEYLSQEDNSGSPWAASGKCHSDSTRPSKEEVSGG